MKQDLKILEKSRKELADKLGNNFTDKELLYINTDVEYKTIEPILSKLNTLTKYKIYSELKREFGGKN